MSDNSPLMSQYQVPPTCTAVGAGSGIPPASVVTAEKVTTNAAEMSLRMVDTPEFGHMRRADGTTPADCFPQYSTGIEQVFLRLWDAGRYGEAGTLALRIALSASDPDRFVYTGRAGACFWKLDDYSAAHSAFSAADHLSHTTTDSRLLARHHNNYGLLCWSTGRLTEALRHYELARPHYEVLRRRDMIAALLNNVGLVYADMGRCEEAINHLKLAESIYEELGDKARLVDVADSIYEARKVAYRDCPEPVAPGKRGAGGDWGASRPAPA